MTRDPQMLVRQGERKGQIRYYLRAAAREPWGKKWRRFWVSRWFWSAGRFGPIPVGYRPTYWTTGTRLTGSCPIREHTGDGAYVGRCCYGTYDGFCPRHGAVVDYPRNDDRDVLVSERRHV